MPAVSVIVPVYNVEKQLRRCLDSILAQNFQDYEVLCVNDASPDNCAGILEEYAARDPRIKVTHFPENRGPGAARNEAIRRASGETMVACDPDDVIPRDSLGKRYAVWKEYGAVVRGQRLNLAENGEFIEHQEYMPEYRGAVVTPARDIRHLKLLVSHHLWLLPLELIRKGQVEYHESMRNAQDTWFLAQIFFKIPKLIWLENVVYILCVRPSSATNRAFSLQNHINRIKNSEKFYEEAVLHKKLPFGDKYFSDLILSVFDGLRFNASVDMDRDLDQLIQYTVGISDKYSALDRILKNTALLPQHLGLVFLHYILRHNNGSLKYRLHKTMNDLDRFTASGKL
ncbi:MAG: glycosyltransferase [Desulfovibrionaceae bacterium]|nr:glycosyltransferase [Desulfovibrionaceae bacterium]